MINIFITLMTLISFAADPASDEGSAVGGAVQEEQAAAGSENEVDESEGNDAQATSGDVELGDTSDAVEPVPVFTPVLRYAPSPIYPRSALDEGIGGSVLLEIDIDVDGSVFAVSVIESERADFAESARTNARSFVFEPLLNADGKAEPFRIQYRTIFEAATAAPVSVEGKVREAGPRTVIKGAEVLAVGPSNERILSSTDENGAFQLADLPPGTWRLVVSASGHVDEVFEIQVVDKKVSTLVAYLIRDELRAGTRVDEEIVVTALAPRTEVTERKLTAEEVRYLPGTGGDVVKVVQNLPGVARGPLGTGNLRIRGTAPEDSLYFIDGGRIPIVFHFSGLTTVMSGDLLEEVVYLPGSYSVQYGRILGGLVDLRTKRDLPERSNGNLSVDLFQTALFVEQRLGDRDAITFAGRRSYADVVLNPILNKGSLTVQAPRYYDGQLRWSRKLDNGWNDVLVLMSDDRFRFLGQGKDETVLAGFATQFQKIRWLQSRKFANDVGLEASVVFGPEKKFFETDNTSEAYEKEMRLSARLQVAQPLAPGRRVGWVVGTDPNFNHSSFLYDIARPPERTVSSSREAPIESGEFDIWQPSLFGEVSLRSGDVTVTPGVRADMQFVDSTTVSSIDPRIRGAWAVSDGTVLKGGGGRHSQAPTSRQLSLASDGNPNLVAESSYQFSGGIEQIIVSWLTLDITGFYHHLDDLVVGREDRFSFYSGPPPAGPFDSEPYANDGTGRAFGAEMLASIEADNTSGLLSGTWSRSDRVKRPGADRTLFEYDQPLVINALISRKLPRRWRVGARIRYGSGNPYTPVANRIYNHDRREFIPVYGERDSGRLPPFFSVDLRIDKDYVFRKWTLTTYLDIQNATYSKNVESQGYSYDYGAEEPILSSPPVPAFGLRGEW
jgi:TonB family protein